MAQNFNQPAYSFSHGVIRVGGRQFIGIRNVGINQELTETAIYGTDIRPIGRSVGQLSMGRGNLTFGDYEEGTDFWTSMGAQPLMAIWDLDYAQVRSDGSTRSINCVSCRLLGVGIEHEAGADALEISYPFSFLHMQVERVESIFDAKIAINAAIDIAQSLF
jgi:hypothetical protein